MHGFASGREHLMAKLLRLDLMLQRQVLRLRAARLLIEDEFRGLYIPDEQIDALLNHQSRPSAAEAEFDSAAALTSLIEQIHVENENQVMTSLQAGIDLPMPRLAEMFELSPYDMELLLISVAAEVDLRYETLYAYVQNDVTKKRPTVDLALQLLCNTIEERLELRTAFSGESSLFRNHLVELYDDPQDREPPLLARFMKTDQRVVDFLLDRYVIDERLVSFTDRIQPISNLAELPLPDGLISQLSFAARTLNAQGGILLFQGSYGVGKQAAAEALCAELGIPLLVADLGQAMASEQPLSMIAALLQREAILQSAGLYLAHFDTLLDPKETNQAQVSMFSRALGEPTFPVFLGSEDAWYPAGVWPNSYFLRFEFPLPIYTQRLILWQENLHDNGRNLDDDVDLSALANKFVLSAGQIRNAARLAANLTSIRAYDQRAISMNDLYTAARAQSNQGLRRLAQKIEPIYHWIDIVLPRRPMQQLREVFASVRYRHVVYSTWGFARKLSLGRGVNALFSGPSGTGKTMAAQILARELNLDLYKIDLSGVISKYIGETEKNLDRIFREAQHSNAILFFDEADALFGKRSEVKDAHDRYANIEVAYLLQKMEEYDGIVILATNLRKNMDEAFTRRMHHIVDFPFPDEESRERIWQGLIPFEVPLADDIDFRFLARQFELTGGNIRNVALAAAFMAAEEGEHLNMQHMILATARELYKMGKLPSKAGFGAYYELIREYG